MSTSRLRIREQVELKPKKQITPAAVKSVASVPTPTRFQVAVFPLKNTVLFPGVTLPLHIFEQRYWQMLHDVQDKGLPLAVALLHQDENNEMQIYPVCGAGEVQIAQDYPDGRSDVLVHGKQRVRLCSVIQKEPYFIMEAEAVDNETTIEPLTARTLDEVLKLVKVWAFMNPDVPDYLTLLFDEFSKAGELADFFAFHFLSDPEEQQMFLDCTNPAERGERLALRIESDLLRLNKKLNREKKFLLLH